MKTNMGVIKMDRKALKAGLIGGIGGLVFSMVMNYFVIPMPDSLIGSAFGNGISGLISGLMGGFLAIKNTKI
jgi:hypothetical protein